MLSSNIVFDSAWDSSGNNANGPRTTPHALENISKNWNLPTRLVTIDSIDRSILTKEVTDVLGILAVIDVSK